MPKRIAKWLLGRSPPYLAVILGVFFFKSGLFAVLLYHLILTICIISINRSNTPKLLASGFHRTIGPLICLGGLLPGMAIFFLWPFLQNSKPPIWPN